MSQAWREKPGPGPKDKHLHSLGWDLKSPHRGDEGNQNKSKNQALPSVVRFPSGKKRLWCGVGTRPVVLSQLLVLKTTQPSHTWGEWGTNAEVQFSVSNILERAAKLSCILQLKNLAPSNKMCCTILRKVWFFLKKTTCRIPFQDTGRACTQNTPWMYIPNQKRKICKVFLKSPIF